MASQILLINFQQEDADALKTLGVKVDRGYYSDAFDFERIENRSLEQVYYFLPQPIQEYQAIIVNLTYNTAIETEFRPKRTLFDKMHRVDFSKYWNETGILMFICGDYDYKGLSTFGVFHVEFGAAAEDSNTIRFALEETTPFRKMLSGLKDQLLLPVKKSIITKDSTRNGKDWEIRSIFTNSNDDVLGSYYTKTTIAEEDRPRFIILPQMKNNTLVITQLLNEIARIYPELLPELSGEDWRKEDKYYPDAVRRIDRQIIECKRNMEKQLKELAKKKTEAKKEYENLKKILCLQGDELKQSIVKVLSEFFSCKVIDMKDWEYDGSNDCILIESAGRKILAKIHGTYYPHAGPKLITQIWQHLRYSNLEKNVEGALIINHDIYKDPEERMPAYTDEYDEQLEDIIFIDTRELFKLAIAVIDYGLPVEEAKTKLLSKGRVQFDLEAYREKEGKPA